MNNIEEKDINTNHRKTIIIHTLIWLLYFAMQFIWRYTSFGFLIFMAGFTQVLSWAIIFYAIRLYIYPKFLWKDNKKLFLYLLILYIVFQIFSIAYTEFFLEMEGSKSPFTIIGHCRKGFFWFFNMSFVAFGFTYYDELGKEKARRLQTQTELQKTQIELKNSQLDSLKAQFNPHFLFNTLWYIYALVQDTGRDRKSVV